MPSPARRPSLLGRLLARLGRSLAAWGDPFLFEPGRRGGNGTAEPASREETVAVAEALARQAAIESPPRDAGRPRPHSHPPTTAGAERSMSAALPRAAPMASPE